MTERVRFDANLPPTAVNALARMTTQRVRAKRDLRAIVFQEDMAAVMVDSALLPAIPFKNAERTDARRIAALTASIRAKGYQPRDPIICRIGRKGKWVVVDGGHRLTALTQEMRRRKRLIALRFLRWLGVTDWLPPTLLRWLRAPSYDVYFILFRGERSLGRA